MAGKSKKKTDFEAWDWNKGHVPLRVAFPPGRPKTAHEKEVGLRRMEAASRGPVEDPNMRPEVFVKITDCYYKSPFRGWEGPGRRNEYDATLAKKKAQLGL